MRCGEETGWGPGPWNWHIHYKGSLNPTEEEMPNALMHVLPSSSSSQSWTSCVWRSVPWTRCRSRAGSLGLDGGGQSKVPRVSRG